jgi:hypothetical protein
MADIYVNNAIHTKGLYLQNTRDWFQTGIFTDNITRVVSLSGMPSVTKIEIQWDRHASGDARSYNWKDQNAEHIFENLPNPRVQMNIQAN